MKTIKTLLEEQYTLENVRNLHIFPSENVK